MELQGLVANLAAAMEVDCGHTRWGIVRERVCVVCVGEQGWGSSVDIERTVVAARALERAVVAREAAARASARVATLEGFLAVVVEALAVAMAGMR